MATATRTQRARQATQRAAVEPGPVAITFVVVEDNSGDYRWTMVDGRGDTLGQSPAFATYESADTAAGVVRDALGSDDDGRAVRETGR